MEDINYLNEILMPNTKVSDIKHPESDIVNKGKNEPETTQQKQENNEVQTHEFMEGDVVIHPGYGEGTIVRVEKSCYLSIKFPGEAMGKEMSGDWVLKNCKLIKPLNCKE